MLKLEPFEIQSQVAIAETQGMRLTRFFSQGGSCGMSLGVVLGRLPSERTSPLISLGVVSIK